MTDLGNPRRGRSVALLSAAVAALVGTAHLVRPTPPAPDFASALAWLAGWVLCGCCCWAVLIGLALVAASVREPSLLVGCCPRSWRPVVLAAAGAAVAASTALPAHAEGWQAPALGRPVDRPPAAALAVPEQAGQAGPSPAAVQVRPGDSLWRLLAGRHPAADDATLAALVAATYRMNRAVIGPDPDLLRPGQALQLPDERSPR